MTTPRNYSILTLKCKGYSHDGYVANLPIGKLYLPFASLGNSLREAYHIVFSYFLFFSSGITYTFWYLRVFANIFYPFDSFMTNFKSWSLEPKLTSFRFDEVYFIPYLLKYDLEIAFNKIKY